MIDRAPPPRPRLATAAALACALLVGLQTCQRNRLADAIEELSRRIDRLEAKRRDGNAVPSGDAAPSPPLRSGARDATVAIERLRRDRSLDLQARAHAGSLLPADHPAFDGRGDERIPPLEIGRRGGSLRVPLRGDVDGFNPICSKSLASFGVLFQVFDPLFFIDPWNLQLLPRLATGYDVSPDLLEWTVHLRPGVAWSDGAPFTADDVCFTYDLMRRPDVVSYSSRELDYDVDGRRVPVTWTKVDDLTVRFRQPLPYPAFPNKLAFRLIVPAHRLRDIAAAGRFQSHWGVGLRDFADLVGTGPFRITSYSPGARIELARNDRYWGRDRAGAALPYLDALTFDVLDSPDVAWLRFRGGELDLLGDLPCDLVPAADDLAKSGAIRRFDIGTDIGWVYLVFNQRDGAGGDSGRPCVEPHRLAWFRDRRFRRAISRALDRSAMADVAEQGQAKAAGPVFGPSSGVFHDAAIDAGRCDRAEAARLLDEMLLVDRDGDGIREDAAGHPVELALAWYERTPDLTPIASMVADQLRPLGVRVRLERVDSARFSHLLFESGEFDALLGEDSSGLALPAGDHPLFSSSTEYHLWNPRQARPATTWEAEIDELFRKASLERDPAVVLAQLSRFQRIVAEEEPMLFLVSKLRNMACRADVRNFRPAPLEPAVYWNAAEIFRAP